MLTSSVTYPKTMERDWSSELQQSHGYGGPDGGRAGEPADGGRGSQPEVPAPRGGGAIIEAGCPARAVPQQGGVHRRGGGGVRPGGRQPPRGVYRRGGR